MGINNTDSLVIKNAVGQEMAWQETYDGKLLLDVMIQPLSNTTIVISKGKPSIFKSLVQGRMYPERADDITWENDRGIYRMYGPAIQRSGEQLYGIDVWVKNTPEPVVEDRYRLHLWGYGQSDSLRVVGKSREADEIYLATSFHYDHGLGLDCYGVGASLGCGAPALMRNDKLHFPYCYKYYKILDNGPLRFTVELTFGADADGITEHRIISLDKGSHFNRITVWYDGICQPTTLAMGIVMHSDDYIVLGRNYIQYADPTENPKVHQSQIYVAALFPYGVDKTMIHAGEQRHALGIIKDYLGEPYTYYFGSAWSNYDIRSQIQWQLCIQEYLNNQRNPLNIQKL